MPTISCIFVFHMLLNRGNVGIRSLTCVAFACRLSGAEKKPSSEAVAEYLEERKKYDELRQRKGKKGSNREEQVTSRPPSSSPWSRSAWDLVKS